MVVIRYDLSIASVSIGGWSNQPFKVQQRTSTIFGPAQISKTTFCVEETGARRRIVRIESDGVRWPAPTDLPNLLHTLATDPLPLSIGRDSHRKQIQRPDARAKTGAIDRPRLLRRQPQGRDQSSFAVGHKNLRIFHVEARSFFGRDSGPRSRSKTLRQCVGCRRSQLCDF
jgi:hypothetical protein